MQNCQVQIGNNTEESSSRRRTHAFAISPHIVAIETLPSTCQSHKCILLSKHIPCKSFLWPLTNLQWRAGWGNKVSLSYSVNSAPPHTHPPTVVLNAFNYLLQPLDEFLWPEHEPPTTFTICDIVPRDFDGIEPIKQVLNRVFISSFVRILSHIRPCLRMFLCMCLFVFDGFKCRE